MKCEQVYNGRCAYYQGVWLKPEGETKWEGTCFRHLPYVLDLLCANSDAVIVTYDRRRAER